MGIRGARGPRSGDLVRAFEDRRRAMLLEGILYIRYVPILDYVQVAVIEDGHLYDADPETIEVLRRAAVSVETLVRDDPLRSTRGWRQVDTLDQARAQGLVLPPISRDGVPWADLLKELDSRVAPLLAAGWKITEHDQDESFNYGDSVSYRLERGALAILIEYHQSAEVRGDWLQGKPAQQNPATPSDEPSEPAFTVAEGTNDACARAFCQQGWMEPPVM